MSFERLDNELEALLSIYPESIDIIPNSSDLDSESLIALHYNYRYIVTVVFKLQKYSYPQSSPPTFSLTFHHGCLYRNEKDRFNLEIQRIIDENIGNEVLFQLIQKLNELVDDCYDSLNTTESKSTGLSIKSRQDDKEKEEDDDDETFDIKGSNKNPYIKYGPPSVLPTSEKFTTTNQLNVIHGEITKEKKSSFQSHLCFVQSMEDVHLFRQIVLSDKRIASATHNIFVYRFTKVEESHNNHNQSSNNGSSSSNNANIISYHDFDDDGETAAGSRLAEMIRLMKVDGIAMVVSRWFGGIKLGPDRFKFICNSARTLLETSGFVK